MDATDTCHSGPSGSDAKMDLEVPEFLGGGNSCEREGGEVSDNNIELFLYLGKEKGKKGELSGKSS